MSSQQYSTGLSRHNIEQALVQAGFRLDDLQPADLAPLEDFHTLGRIATSQLADLAEINSHDRVLDAGSGIGGTSRFLADRSGCTVMAVDLTEEYCETARWLNGLVRLDRLITVRQGDVADLPFGDGDFDVVFSQHVQMNVADKPKLYAQARRVLTTGGRLAIWDVVTGSPGPLRYPLPWASAPEQSYLVSPEQLRATIVAAGFAIAHWNDLTQESAGFMESFVASPPGPLGLHTFVENFTEKSTNLTRELSAGRLRVIQATARATAD
jgi:sarcosine/dimethylglycine N-methyltransferase